MGQTGLITFSEYLFLLCILTRPRQGFDVAFKMFDEDGNKQIDYDEFKLLGQGFRKKLLTVLPEVERVNRKRLIQRKPGKKKYLAKTKVL